MIYSRARSNSSSTPLEQLELALQHAQTEWERKWHEELEQHRLQSAHLSVTPVGLAAALARKTPLLVGEPVMADTSGLISLKNSTSERPKPLVPSSSQDQVHERHTSKLTSTE